MNERRKRALASAVRAVLVSLAFLPWLPQALSGMSLLDRPLQLLDGWFALHCHRDAARGLTGLAVCVRCYGIYFGLGAGALVVRPRLRPAVYRVWLLVAALALMLDVATELLAMRPAWAPLRFLTGALLGYPVGVSLVLATRPSAVDRGATDRS